MKEKILLKVALIGAIVGVAILYFVSEEIALDESLIADLDGVPDGDEVMVIGVVTRVTNTDKVAFLEVAQEKIDQVTVVLFKDRDIKLEVGDVVEIVGSVEDYEGKREIIGNKVVLK